MENNNKKDSFLNRLIWGLPEQTILGMGFGLFGITLSLLVIFAFNKSFVRFSLILDPILADQYGGFIVYQQHYF